MYATFYKLLGNKDVIFRDNEPGGDWPSNNLSQWIPPTPDSEGHWAKKPEMRNVLCFQGWPAEIDYFVKFVQDCFRLVGKDLTIDKAREKLFEPEK